MKVKVTWSEEVEHQSVLDIDKADYEQWARSLGSTLAEYVEADRDWEETLHEYKMGSGSSEYIGTKIIDAEEVTE